MIRSMMFRALILIVLAFGAFADDACRIGLVGVKHTIEGGPFRDAFYADVNEDGRVDIVSTRGGSQGQLALHLNRGNGMFEAIEPGNPLFTLFSIEGVLDFDGDHHLDLVVNGSSTILRGKGDGTFQPPFVVPSKIAEARYRRVLDYDHDGIYDLLAAEDDAAYFERGIGGGLFAAPISNRLLQVDYSGGDYRFGDFDGDGNIDFMRLRNEQAAGIAYILWSAATKAPVQRFYSTTASPIQGREPFDSNADGAEDLLASSGKYVVAIHFVNRDYQKEILPFPGDSLGDGAARSPMTADIDGDGRRDLLFQYGFAVAVARGQEDGKYAVPKLFNLAGAGKFALADVDGDGYRDIAAIDGNPALNLIRGGPALFATPYAQTLLPLAFSPDLVHVADLNGDGHLDLIASDASRPQVSVWLNDGQANFQQRFTSNYAGPGVSGFAGSYVADLDGDSILDLIFYAAQSGPPLVAFGTGDGTFTRVTVNLTGVALRGTVRTTDASGVALLGVGNGEVKLVRIARDGTASTSASITTLPENGYVHAFDYDGDGYDEIAVVSGQTIGISKHSGNAWQTAVTASFGASNSSPQRLMSRDLNGDHMPEVLGVADGNVHILWSNGAALAEKPAPSINASDYAVSDIDGDGQAEVIVAYGVSSSSYLRIYRNNGSNTFSVQSTAPFPLFNPRVRAADFDHDGRDELISTLSAGIAIERFGCTPADLQVALAPGIAYVNHPIRLLVQRTLWDAWDSASLRIYQDGKAATLKPALAFNDGLLIWTSPALTVGAHEFRVEYQNHFGELVTITKSVDVLPIPPKRRAVR